jgi:hypothetical protein
MYYSLISSMKKSSFDADAQAFINAAAITNATQQTAINSLVVSLKSYGIWSKMKALYPFIGGTAASHKFNLKDPRDLDIAFRLVFNGGITHTANGLNGNSTNGYANTFFNVLGYKNNNHISLYITSNIDELSVDMGVFAASTNSGIDIETRISNNAYFLNFLSATYINFANTDSRGFYLNSRTLSTLYKIYKNNILKSTNTSTSYADFTGNISICGRFNITTGTVQYFSSKNYAFASIGDGLTDTEASNFYAAIQSYQTTLGRQV